MKLKLQFDQKAIQEFLLQNVEKIGLGIVVCIFIFMVYSAVRGVDRDSRTPNLLVQAVKQGQDEIARTDPDSELIKMTPLTADEYKKKYEEGYGNKEGKQYVDRAEGSRVPIQPKLYATEKGIDEPLFQQRVLRGPPPLLAVQDLRGTAEVGAFQMAAEEAPAAPPGAVPGPMGPGPMGRGGNELRGQRWIVVTGLVPVEKQELAYIEAFKSAVNYDANRDYPEYSDYQVERMEVASPGEAADPDWKDAKPLFTFSRDLIDATKKWVQVGTEVVTSEYLNQMLVFPLGPLVGRLWTESVAHPPEIPLPKANQLAPGMGPGMVPGMGPGLGPGSGVPGAGFGGGGTRRPRTQPGVGGPISPGAGGHTPPAGDSPFGGNKNRPSDTAPGETNPGIEQPKPPAFLLFRYFDYDVKPGKNYVYRVRLALRNPNYDMKPVHLKDPELAKPGYVVTKWSDPSPAISVPRETRVLLASVTPGRSHDPSGKVMVVKWVEEKGVEAHGEFSMVRGQVANFSDQKFRPANAPGAVPGSMGGVPHGMGGVPGVGPMPPGTGPGGLGPMDGPTAPGGGAGRARSGGGHSAPRNRTPAGAGGAHPPGVMTPGLGGGMPLPADAANEIEVSYITGATAVDFRGGQPLAGRRGVSLKLSAAGEMLLLDPDGILVVRNELDDQAACQELTRAETESAERSAAGPLGPGRRPLDGLEGPRPPTRRPGR